MRKIFYHNFMPTKDEEEAQAAAVLNGTVRNTRTLIEISDPYAPPRCKQHSTVPCYIRKNISRCEVERGVLVVSEEYMMEHVFRYWSLDMANHVVRGNTCIVSLVDCTEDVGRKRYDGENVFVKYNEHDNETYVIGIRDVVVDRAINPGDDIIFLWGLRDGGCFAFKILGRA